MIEHTLAQIEARLKNSSHLKADTRRELQELLAKLKAEVAALSPAHAEQAESIAGFTERSAHEATRVTPNSNLLKLSLAGLTSSVEEFEKTHPKLVQVVNSISQALSNVGI